MDVLPVVAAWAIENLSPQKILKAIGFGSVLLFNNAIVTELGPLLSPGATILTSSSPQFLEKTTRWQERLHAPQISVVVDVATAEDARAAVQWAFKKRRPWIAMNGGHGNTKALGDVRDGVQIDMRRLKSIRVSDDGLTAIIQAGVTAGQAIPELFAQGKQTTTGICECVGMTGALLGGGHGLLQGQYGLMIDQLVEANMILPNATAITVSQTSHPDLWWAVRGAGHNFGLVTEYTYKIYDVDTQHKWSWEFYFFRPDQLESVFALAQEMIPTQPARIVTWSFEMLAPDLDPVHPSIISVYLYDGDADELNEYTKIVRDLNPLGSETGHDAYPDLPSRIYQGMDGPACARGFSVARFSTVLQTYNITALRKVYDLFDEMIQQWPQLNTSTYLLEGYPTQAVKAVPHDSTAFPHRGYDLLFVPYFIWRPNPEIESVALKYGKRMRDILVEGSGEPTRLNSYLGYAHGDEAAQAIYGWEPWRLEKLKDLKHKYDPTNALRWYVPIL